MHSKLTILSILVASSLVLATCSSQEEESQMQVVGRFIANYDAETGEVSFTQTPLSDESNILENTVSYSLDYSNSTGTIYCAIRDHSKGAGQLNSCLGLVDPDSCSTSWNSVTKTLSFYVKLINRSNLPNNYDASTNPTGYEYTDTATYPPNTTFHAPFHFRLWNLNWSPAGSQLINAVNTNLPGSDCGSDGLDLDTDDTDNNNRFDCTGPDETSLTSDDGDPGWDFSAFITGAQMAPGDDTGCVLFMQYQLESNSSFSLGFDVLAIKDDGSLPSTPTVSSPSSGTSTNSSTTTVTGTCTSGGTVYVEGGDASGTYPPSTSCSGGTYSMSVPLNSNTLNTLSVYQKVNVPPVKQSPSVVLEVTHDDIAPTLVSSIPGNNATSVNRNINCVFEFSEPMDTSTFSTGSSCSTPNGSFYMCRLSSNDDGSPDHANGTITFSDNNTIATFEHSYNSLTAERNFTCNATADLTDVAGNALTATTISFQTAKSGNEYTDRIGPIVKAIVPADGATIAPGSNMYIYFNEAIDGGNLNSDSCTSTVDNIGLLEFSGCGDSASEVSGTATLSADKKVVTFDPTNTLTTNSCYAIVVQKCIQDISGNKLADRGTVQFGSRKPKYNTIHFFRTDSGASSSGPAIVHMSPIANATGVLQDVQPLIIFDKPLDPLTVLSDYFLLAKQGETSNLPLSVDIDSSLQVLRMEPVNALTTTDTASHLVTVTGAVTDFGGNQMSSPETSAFTISSTADTTKPTVVSIVPSVTFDTAPDSDCSDGENYVSKCATFDVYFSEPIDPTTLTSGNVQLFVAQSSNSCPGPAQKAAVMEVAHDQMSVRLIPVSALRSSGDQCSGGRRTYYIQVSDIQDLAGNTIASTYRSINYSACQESDAPGISAVVPASGGTIASGGNFAVLFDEPMDPTSLKESRFDMSTCDGESIVSVTPDLRSVVVNCSSSFSGSGTLRIDRNVRDYYRSSNNGRCDDNKGNRMPAHVESVYGVESADSTAPTISALSDVSPQDGSTQVATTIDPTITFSEALDPRTITPTSVFMTDNKGNIVDTRISLSTDARTITLSPVQDLNSSGIYYIIATTAIRDLGGGNAYDGSGGESTSISGVLRTCFSTDSTACP